MYEAVPGINIAFSADGGTDGFATVTSNTGVYPGMRGFISDTTGAVQAVLAVELSGATKVGLRYIAEDGLGLDDPKVRSGSVRQYQVAGRTPLATWTVANGARMTFGTQVVPVQQPVFNPSFRPV